jgi:phage terminase Nu1 subunit (DNA packaging protein)
MHYKDAVSRYAFAKRIGVTLTHVKRLVESGVLQTDDNDMLSSRAALKAYNAYQEKIKESGRGRKTAVKLLDELKDCGGEDFKAIYEKWMANVDRDPQTVLNAARAYLTAVQAKEEKLKLDELEGRLYSIDKINADAEAVGTIVRSKLLALPARVATMCEGRSSRDIEEIITDELNGALEEMQKLFV